MFKVGQSVQLRKRCKSFTFGKGGVDVASGEVGVVKGVDDVEGIHGVEIVINFPSCRNWNGIVDEVKIAHKTPVTPANLMACELPGCCTATIVYRFGRSLFGIGKRERFSKPSIIKRLEILVKQRGGQGCIVATTTSEQVLVNEALEEFGFYKTPPMKKLNHSSVNLILWHYPILGYVKEAS